MIVVLCSARAVSPPLRCQGNVMRADVNRGLALVQQSVLFLGKVGRFIIGADGGDRHDGPAVSGLEQLQEAAVPEMLRYLLEAPVRKPV